MTVSDRRGVTVTSTDPASQADPHPGLAIKAPVRVATTANITLSGLQTIDAVAVAEGNRVLVKNQSTSAQNGIYVASTGVWERARDMDDNSEMADGCLVQVRAGTASAGFSYIMNGTDPIIVGTSAITFTKSGAPTATIDAILALAATIPALTATINSILGSTVLTATDQDAIFPNGRRLTAGTAITATDGGAGADLLHSLSFTPAVGGRNFLGNARYVVVQRGLGPWTAGSPTYTVDFWGVTRFGTAGATASRQAGNAGTGVRYKMRVQRDSGNSNTQLIAFYQALFSDQSKELAGRTVTLSFYAQKGANYSASGNTLVSRITTGTGNDQAASGAPGVSWTGAGSDSQNNTLSTTRTFYSHTFTIPSGTTQVGVSFFDTPVGTAGAADYFEVDSVQLEIGAAPTAFQGLRDDEDIYFCSLAYEDMAYGSLTGTRDLRVISACFANTAGAVTAPDQFFLAAVRMRTKRNDVQTLTVGPADSWHVTMAGAGSYYNLEVVNWVGHASLEDAMLEFKYVQGGSNPALVNFHAGVLALDGSGKATKFAIDCGLAP